MEQQQYPARQPLRFQFTGSGGEYFKIWIVNLLLTIVTLGIYSAWAKVRRNRYFYGNTQVAGASFDYLATPRAILRGRLIAFGVFMVYSFVTQALPMTGPVFSLAFIAILPWLIVRALAFRARNTAYRNLRFDFQGDYRGAIKAYVLLPLLLVVTFGFAYPFILQRQKAFVVDNSRYGTTAFGFHGQVRDFYGVMLPFLLIAAGGFVVVAALFRISMPLAVVAGVLLYVWLFAYNTAEIGNLVYGGTRLGEHRFRSNLGTRDLFVLYLTNMLGMALTFGFFIPWAQVRLARYRAGHLTLLAAGDIEHFVGGETEKVTSTGEELGEMFDVGVGV